MNSRTASTSADGRISFTGEELSYNETVDAICNFLTIATNTILRMRQVYPATVFERRAAYSVPVWACRHEGTSRYIDDAITAAKVQILKTNVSAIHVAITSISTGQILERYRFDLDFILRDVVTRDRNLAIPRNLTKAALELHLRGFMQKLMSIDGALEEVEEPEDLTWALVLIPKDGRQPETSDSNGNEPPEGPWVPFDDGPLLSTSDSYSPASSALDARVAAPASSASRAEEFQARPRGRNDGSYGLESAEERPMILPVKSLDTGVINLMLYVEEHPQAKRSSSRAYTQAVPSTARRRPYSSAAAAGGTQAQSQPAPEERDLDALPPQRPMGSKRKAKAGAALVAGAGADVDPDEPGDEERSASDSENSSSSMGSVGDFAGYGGNAGGAGMAGTRM